MEITIRGDASEIAALVLALQERQDSDTLTEQDKTVVLGVAASNVGDV